MRHRSQLFWLTGLLLLSVQLTAAEAIEPSAVLRWQTDTGTEHFTLASKNVTEPGRIPVFRAVTARHWPAGLVPIFSVSRRGRVELRRFPPAGQEGLTEPLFFAVCPENEGTDPRILGRWECRAQYSDGAEEFFYFEFTAQGDRVVGRFDVETDFRFASVERGRLTPNGIDLEVRYIAAEYLLKGTWDDSALQGTWKHRSEEEHGTWRAERLGKAPSWDRAGLLPLWVYRDSEKRLRYRVGDEAVDPTWERISEPLCWVWPLLGDLGGGK